MEVKFKLADDPIEYCLTFDFNQIVDAESICGCNLLSAIEWPRAMTAAQSRGLLYALLKTAHPKVLLGEAGDLLTRDILTVSKAVLVAIFGADGDETEPAPPEEHDG